MRYESILLFSRQIMLLATCVFVYSTDLHVWAVEAVPLHIITVISAKSENRVSPSVCLHPCKRGISAAL